MRKTAAISVILLLVGFCTCSSQPPRQPGAVGLLSLGEQYLTDLYYDQALVRFLKVIEVEPRNVRAYLGAVEAYIALGQIEEAIAILELEVNETGDEALKERYYKLLRTDDAYYTALDAEQKQMLTEITQALEALDWEAAYAIQSSAACSELAAGLPLNERGNRRTITYYPDDTTCVIFFQTVSESSVSSHMDIFRGTNGNGSMAVSVYDAYVHYRMDTVGYSDGKANGAFTGRYLGGSPSDFYTVTGIIRDGAPDGDFTREQAGDVLIITEAEAERQGFDKWAEWPGALVS